MLLFLVFRFSLGVFCSVKKYMDNTVFWTIILSIVNTNEGQPRIYNFSSCASSVFSMVRIIKQLYYAIKFIFIRCFWGDIWVKFIDVLQLGAHQLATDGYSGALPNKVHPSCKWAFKICFKNTFVSWNCDNPALDNPL